MTATDTICAVSTPLGTGGIGIVRLSGSHSVSIAERVVRCADGVSLSDGPSHTLRYGHAHNDAGDIVDEVLVSVMRAPRTYTREDIVEINCHGGVMPLIAILETALAAGARMAEAGEFTRRAFVNGRIDLTRAEAVLDIISARTPEGHRAAAARLSGRFQREVEALRTMLLDARASLDASIDFPEDDLPVDIEQRYVDDVTRARDSIGTLLAGADRGRLLREGVTVAITGRPNVGKSSLFNALLRTNRAIVTPVPGTTRDVIEETVNIGGIPVVLMDGAGLRAGRDEPEQMGVEMAWAAVDDAAAVVVVLEASETLTDEDWDIVERLAGAGKPRLVVLNKIDLARKLDEADVGRLVDALVSPEPAVEVSATQGANIDGLEDALARVLVAGTAGEGMPTYVTRVREKRSLEDARDALDRALVGVKDDRPPELVAVDLCDAVESLGVIIGAVTTEDILDRVFGEFCIGK